MKKKRPKGTITAAAGIDIDGPSLTNNTIHYSHKIYAELRKYEEE